MTQVINHDLGHKIVHNPGYDFDLGYKNKSKFFYYPSFKSVTCVGYALEGQFLLCTTKGSKSIILNHKRYFLTICSLSSK